MKLMILFILGLFVGFCIGNKKLAHATEQQKLLVYPNLDKFVTKSAIEQAAEDGNAEAQHTLASMYHSGNGKPKNVSEAAKWELQSAQHGNHQAQLTIAAMYYLGDGVPQDFENAYAWDSVAAANGDENARRLRDLIAGKLDTKALLHAQQLSQGFFPHR